MEYVVRTIVRCASCKKIQEESEAGAKSKRTSRPRTGRISHGLCPECAKLWSPLARTTNSGSRDLLTKLRFGNCGLFLTETFEGRVVRVALLGAAVESARS